MLFYPGRCQSLLCVAVEHLHDLVSRVTTRELHLVSVRLFNGRDLSHLVCPLSLLSEGKTNETVSIGRGVYMLSPYMSQFQFDLRHLIFQ